MRLKIAWQCISFDIDVSTYINIERILKIILILILVCIDTECSYFVYISIKYYCFNYWIFKNSVRNVIGRQRVKRVHYRYSQPWRWFASKVTLIWIIHLSTYSVIFLLIFFSHINSLFQIKKYIKHLNYLDDSSY